MSIGRSHINIPERLERRRIHSDIILIGIASNLTTIVSSPA